LKIPFLGALLLAGAAQAHAAEPAAPDPSTVSMPDLSGATTADDEKGFDKYYYFHRAGTDFATALADIQYCDGLARGLSTPFGNAETPYPYNGTLAGAVGGAIGNALVSAIFGSAQARHARRVNIRRCMHYKGYGRYGARKDAWQQFNFEEGLSGVADDKRRTFLMQQAKVASGPKPTAQELGL